MKQPGRRSAAAHEVVLSGPVTLMERPEPPLHLTPEETDEWNAVVGSMPADWFKRETHPLLEQYCRHAVNARRIGDLIDQAMGSDPLDVAQIKELLKMQASQTTSMKTLAASMRIAQQSSYSARGAAGGKDKSVGTMKRPWNDQGVEKAPSQLAVQDRQAARGRSSHGDCGGMLG